MSTCTSSNAMLLELENERPFFEVIKYIPGGLSKQIEDAVHDFIKTSHVPEGVDIQGFYHQTLKGIANASYLNQGGDLWLGMLDGQLVTYILAHVGQDIDHKLTYTVSQAWVRKDQRGKPWVKWAWEKVRQRAKDCLCGHFMVISSRGNDKAYCRFLGKGFHYYASILKEEI